MSKCSKNLIFYSHEHLHILYLNIKTIDPLQKYLFPLVTSQNTMLFTLTAIITSTTQLPNKTTLMLKNTRCTASYAARRKQATSKYTLHLVTATVTPLCSSVVTPQYLLSTSRCPLLLYYKHRVFEPKIDSAKQGIEVVLTRAKNQGERT